MLSIEKRATEEGFVPSSDPIQPGDIYLAERNTGPHLLTCLKVVNNEFGKPSYIVPVEIAYCYDAWECIKVSVLAESEEF